MDDELDDELSIGVFIASYHFLYITDFFIVAVAPNPGTRNRCIAGLKHIIHS